MDRASSFLVCVVAFRLTLRIAFYKHSLPVALTIVVRAKSLKMWRVTRHKTVQDAGSSAMSAA